MRTLCIDFDGVIHSYLSGWQGATEIPDPPVKGAFEWLTMLARSGDWEVCIYSSRSKEAGAIEAMSDWMSERGMPSDVLGALTFAIEKPAAYLTIDDRAICFRGTFPTPLEMRSFRPWTAGFINEIDKALDEADMHEAKEKEAEPAFTTCDECGATSRPGRSMHKSDCSKLDSRISNKPASYTYNWDDCAVEFVFFSEKDWAEGFDDGYEIAILDNDGTVVKTRVTLVEWSGYVTPFINDKDATGLVNYLISLNSREKRDGTVIRE